VGSVIVAELYPAGKVAPVNSGFVVTLAVPAHAPPRWERGSCYVDCLDRLPAPALYLTYDSTVAFFAQIGGRANRRVVKTKWCHNMRRNRNNIMVL
jgi:hypothetical protein